MQYEVRHGSARWADSDRVMLSLDVRPEGETEWWTSTITRNDPSDEFASIFERAVANPPEFGEIAEYVEPPPPPASSPIPQEPPPALPPPPLDWDAEASRFIAAIYTVRGQSVRSSMNVWAAVVALTPEDQRDDFDATCAALVPALNDWEGEVFRERDRLKALEGATLDDAQWPVLPAGAPQFIEWCAEP